MKDTFRQMLLSTGREGADTVLQNLETLGFFEAPASTMFHLSRPGGLAEHSVNVCRCALKVREAMIALDPAIAQKVTEEGATVAALLHDVCKAEVYVKDYRNVKDENGVWVKKEIYRPDYSRCPMGHGEKSVIRLLKWGFDLRDDEMFAIRWHMNAWDLALQSNEQKGNFSAARDKYPLVSILQAADMLACGLMETETGEQA